MTGPHSHPARELPRARARLRGSAPLLQVVLLLLAGLAAPGVASAQEAASAGTRDGAGGAEESAQEQEEQSSVRWSGEVDLGSSLYWGSRSQTIVQTGGSVGRRDDLFRLEADASFVYGESTDRDGVSSVSKRSWEFDVSADYDPDRPLRLYMSGGLASNYQKRYDLRWDVGLGGRFSFSQDRSRMVELSVALEIERTFPSERARRRDGDEDLTGRWSTKLDVRRTIVEDRVHFQSQSNYRPEYDRADTFTASSKNTLSFSVTDATAFKITLVESYDSESVERGADTNSDGRMIFSVSTRFR